MLNVMTVHRGVMLNVMTVTQGCNVECYTEV